MRRTVALTEPLPQWPTKDQCYQNNALQYAVITRFQGATNPTDSVTAVATLAVTALYPPTFPSTSFCSTPGGGGGPTAHADQE